MKISGIYKIQSTIKPERCYIGSAINIKKRWQYHLLDLKKNNHHSSKLQRHFNKYSESDLQFSVLLNCDKKKLIKQEQSFIDSYNPYFNIRKIADSNLGIKRSEEFKRKCSESRKGKMPSLESRLKMSIAKKGKTTWIKGKYHTEETKRKISESHKGRIAWNKGKYGYKTQPHSEETRRKISEAQKGNKNGLGKHSGCSEETRIKMSISRMAYLENKKLKMVS